MLLLLLLVVSRGSRGYVRESERARLMQANMCTHSPFMVIGAVVDKPSTYVLRRALPQGSLPDACAQFG
jgi:hypothetical protein